MAKRFIDTGIFRKPAIRAMKAPYKALFIYLLCECDHAGVWDEEIDVAAMRLGMELDKETALAELGASVKAIGSKWYLTDFVAYQYGELNPANRVHASVISRLQSLGICQTDDKENKPLASPLEGAKDKDKDKDKDSSSGKERARDPILDAFWKAYPEKKGKGAALKAWAKMTSAERSACLPAITAQIAANHFRGVDGKDYIPHPATWLNQRRWEDEVRTTDQPRPKATGWLTPARS